MRKYFKKLCKEVWNFKTRDDIQFIKCATVRTASPHKYFGTLVEKSNAHATSRRCQFFLFVVPFCWGELTHELWCTIPFSRKKFPMTLLKYSAPLSVLNTCIWVLNCVCNNLQKFLIIWPTYDFSFDKYTQQSLVWSSVKVINHFLLDKVLVRLGPLDIAMNNWKRFWRFISLNWKRISMMFSKFTNLTLKEDISFRSNSFRNNAFKYLKLGWPNLKCHNIMPSLLFETKKILIEELIGPDWCLVSGSSSK